jgi:hypothetical protein
MPVESDPSFFLISSFEASLSGSGKTAILESGNL